MRIGLFCDEYPPRRHGGIGVFVRTYAAALAAAGHQPMVVEFGAEAQRRMDGSVPVVTLKAPRAVRGFAEISRRFHLCRWVAAEARAGNLDVFEIPDYEGFAPLPLRPAVGVVRLHLSRRVMGRDCQVHHPRKFALFEGLTLRSNRNWIGVSRHILNRTQEVFGCKPRESQVVYYPSLRPANRRRGVRSMGG